MDSKHYRNLCEEHVVIDGKRYNHKFFQDARDIAFGLSSDGFYQFR
jgi:hypothetical protein